MEHPELQLAEAIAGVWLVQGDRLSSCNARFAELVGYPATELAGAPVLSHVHPEDGRLVS
jgi:hypothetical protein